MAKSNRDTDRRPQDEMAGGQTDKRLTELGKRLSDAKARSPEIDDDAGRRGSAMGVAFRIATELVAGVVVGGFIGWQLDTWLGTKPVLLVIFFVLGAAAGILNVMRTAYQMQAGVTGAENGSKQSGKGPESS